MIIVFLFLGLAIWFCYEGQKESSSDDVFVDTLFSIAICFIGFLIGLAIIIGIGYLPPQYFAEKKAVELVALKDNVATEGNFFLGSGHIEGELMYFYLKKEGDGYRAGKIEAEKVVIFEAENMTPHIQWYSSKFKNWNWNLIAMPTKEKIEIFLPPSSIIRNYKIDLE